MRELKFRVRQPTGNYIYFELAKGNSFTFETTPCIEQYTCLKDKNGKEIYEGDIVSEEFEYDGKKAKTIWQVRWCDDEYAFELHYARGFEIDDCSLDAGENYEIIGNIHENPELLEEQE